MLKKLKIQKFLSVENQILEFGKINIFIGQTDAGKSIIMRAIDAILNNKYTVATYAKHGSSAYLISALTSSGLVTLKKAATTQYAVKAPGIDIVFEAVGKKVPEEAQKILNMPVLPVSETESLDVLYQSQHKPFFLISENRDIFTKVIALISHADKLRDLEKLVNSDVLIVKRKSTALKDVILEYDAQILKQEDVVETLTDATAYLAEFEEFEKVQAELHSKIENLKVVLDKKNLINSISVIKDKIDLDELEKLSLLKAKTDKLLNSVNIVKSSNLTTIEQKEFVIPVLEKLCKSVVAAKQVIPEEIGIPSLKDQSILLKLRDNIQILNQEVPTQIDEVDLKQHSVKLMEALKELLSISSEISNLEEIKALIDEEMSSLVGQQCPYCGQIINSIEDICQ